MAQAMSIHRGSKHENFQTGSRSDAAIQNCKPQGPKPLATTMQRRVADLDDQYFLCTSLQWSILE